MRNLCADEAALTKIDKKTLPQSMVLTGLPLMPPCHHTVGLKMKIKVLGSWTST